MSEARELLRRAASVLHDKFDGVKYMEPLIEEIDAYLAKPEPEPIAWASPNVIPLGGLKDNHSAILTPFKCEANTVPLYAEPPARKTLTDLRILEIAEVIDAKTVTREDLFVDLARAIEKAHGIE